MRTLDLSRCGAETVPATAAELMSIVDRSPALERLTLRLASAVDAAQVGLVADVHDRCVRRGLPLAVEFVLDSDANAFDALATHHRGTAATSLRRVLETSRRLSAKGVAIRWIVPLVPRLVYRLESVFSLARDEGIDPVLAPSSSASADDDGGHTALDAQEQLFVSDFITYRLLTEEKDRHALSRRKAYRALDPLVSTHGPRGAAVSPLVGEDGGMAAVLVDAGLGLAHWTRAHLRRSRRTVPEADAARRFRRVLLIGAYGGEHIGDAAILGGVLLRLQARHGTTRAVLMSQRPVHTRHLVPMIDTPVEIEVDAYARANIRARLAEVDAVVFAGGPLIDLPKQLAKHLYTVSLARRADKPFIMEGIGPGPFPRRVSEWTARRLVRMAHRVSVRTLTDWETPVMRGITAEVGCDPAFDYLGTRGPELTRLRERDRDWIRRLTEGTDGRVIVAMNVRPISDHYTVGVPAAHRAEHTRFIERRFEERCADALRRFHHASTPAPCFVFFPMNAVQFGKSDLRSAYRIARLLHGDVDLRVWEDDASLDGVVALLRRVDLVITMRFHATIFALAERRPVIGIDYRIGQRDKVGALLTDFGRSEDCRRIDEMTSDWLFERLCVLASLRERDEAPPEPGG